MKYPQIEKLELLKISEHFINYSKGYGSMAQTILSMPIPFGNLLSAVFPHCGVSVFKVVHGIGNLSYMSLFFSLTFI